MENSPQQKSKPESTRRIIGIILIILGVAYLTTVGSAPFIFAIIPGVIGMIVVGFGVLLLVGGYKTPLESQSGKAGRIAKWIIVIITISVFLGYLIWLVNGTMKYK